MSTNKRRPRAPGREAGFSLIEFMITSLIIGVIAWLSSSYFGKAQQQAAQQVAQDQSLKMKQSLANMLKRDLAFVVNPSDVVISSLHELTIKRPKMVPGNNRPDLSQSYQVRYRAVCTPIPSTLQTQLSGLSFTSLASTQQARSSCAKKAALKCAGGTYPQLRIEPDAGSNIPVYPGSAFPDLTRHPHIHQAPLGVMPCFEQNGNQITIGLDVFHAKSAGGLSLDLLGERYFMVIGNVSDMVIQQK
ncbi:prepilin-type N-terminal cleavage/methylation domain-containing protein [Oligoflexus tunisiensis]|uniref:prepilin-type N-terminal cleavage/methylation domain-containing protein n=1 Tax=Oligoflexus tunisiensis TaxID=708132 RepID=UPI00159F18E3|nr:prepilin-type N-terminal cleavage/methylation domain-containing protein [Oligoflexus tunisiensis]